MFQWLTELMWPVLTWGVSCVFTIRWTWAWSHLEVQLDSPLSQVGMEDLEAGQVTIPPSLPLFVHMVSLCD